MTAAKIRLFTLVLVGTLVSVCTASDFAQAQRSLSAGEIFQRMEEENVRRAAKLRSYSSMRHYSAFQPGEEPEGEMIVALQFVAPTAKTFTVISEDGVGRFHKRIFHGLLDAELETASGQQKAESSISPANYDVRLIGVDRVFGRDSFVLELTPKRQDKYLLRGKIWVDQQDFAIAKLEGDPVRNPSFWVTRAHIVREYEKAGEFWIPRGDETRCHVRLAGDYILRIDYSDYTLNGQNVICANCAISRK